MTQPLVGNGTLSPALCGPGLRGIIILLLLAGICIPGVNATGTGPQLSLTGPLVIGETVPCSNPVSINLTPGSTLTYSLNGTLFATGPDGTGLFTARERDATRMYVAGGTARPVSRIIVVPQESAVDPVDSHTVEITRYFSDSLLKIRDDSALTVPMTTSGVYYLGTGSSMTAEAGRITLMTRPKYWLNPEVSLMRMEFGEQSRIEILCTGNSTAYSCTGFYIANRTTPLSVSRTVAMSVLPPVPNHDTAALRPLIFSGETSASLDASGRVQYTVEATSSPPGVTMNISNGIHVPTDEGAPRDVFLAANEIFTGPGRHTISHSYLLPSPGMYQAWAAITVTVPDAYATGGNPRKYTLGPVSGILYFNGTSGSTQART